MCKKSLTRTAYIDHQSLYDAVNTMKQTSEKLLLVDISKIREMIENGEKGSHFHMIVILQFWNWIKRHNYRHTCIKFTERQCIWLHRHKHTLNWLNYMTHDYTGTHYQIDWTTLHQITEKCLLLNW